MHIVSLRLEVRFAACRNLRQRRRLVEAMIEKLRQHFNVSVAEVGTVDRPDRSAIGAVAVARSIREAREPLERLAEAVAAHPQAEIIDQAMVEF